MIRWTIEPGQLLRRTVRVAMGMVVFALGNYLTVCAGIGQAPWNVLCMGVNLHLPISYGMATMLISCAILLTDLALGEPIGIATVLDTLMVGPLFDVFDALLHLKAPERLLPGILVMSLGMILLAVGQRIYMPAQFSCGPRAALTVGVGKRLRKLPIGAVEGIIQVSACLTGWLLGGTVGIGTVWFALFNGVAMQGVFRLTKFEPREMNHIGIHQLLKIKHNT